MSDDAQVADARGIPLAGRRGEFDALYAAGYRDLVFGRLFEGHGNALSLIARAGSAEQAAHARDAAERGALFGVWNTGPADGVDIVEEHPTGGVTLRGRKTFCSGADTVAHALITGRRPDGRSQMLLVPMREVTVGIERESWRPLGMLGTDSFAVDFSGVELDASALIGAPDAYLADPWFHAGAARFVAVQAGAIMRLADEFAAFAVRRGTRDDAVQTTRLGECVVAAQTAQYWVRACAEAWAAYDADAASDALLLVVDGARAATERSALDVLERVERGVGARGLLEPEPFSALVRDLRMYLRQPAPDLAVLRVGLAAIERSARA
jgi:alkylation response protein AidB-like acyl-CoA dehydrogenase